MEYESPFERVAEIPPVVTITRRVPRAPLAIKHDIDVSESQLVPVQTVCPNLALCVTALLPKDEPMTVTLVEPVLGTFARRRQLSIVLSVLKASVAITLLTPIVRERLSVEPKLFIDRHWIVVSDIQCVDSQLVPPKETCGENAIRPKFAPCSVRLTDPVFGTLLWTVSSWDRV